LLVNSICTFLHFLYAFFQRSLPRLMGQNVISSGRQLDVVNIIAQLFVDLLFDEIRLIIKWSHSVSMFLPLFFDFVL
jgi:hypothetical protein